jgi:hypothetical protein
VIAEDSVAKLEGEALPAKKRGPRKESTNNDEDLSDNSDDDDLSGDEFGDDGQKRERR